MTAQTYRVISARAFLYRRGSLEIVDLMYGKSTCIVKIGKHANPKVGAKRASGLKVKYNYVSVWAGSSPKSTLSV